MIGSKVWLFMVGSWLTIEIKWVGGCYKLNNLMGGIFISMIWQKVLMLKDGKLKSMEILDGES